MTRIKMKLINTGDRITSLTIDFRHIVQEDAMTILSYASPYNVQLELINGHNRLRSSGSSKTGGEASPKPGRQSPLVHPLVRSSSQSDLNTVSLIADGVKNQVIIFSFLFILFHY
jgi:hypothetical protein